MRVCFLHALDSLNSLLTLKSLSTLGTELQEQNPVSTKKDIVNATQGIGIATDWRIVVDSLYVCSRCCSGKFQKKAGGKPGPFGGSDELCKQPI